MKKVQKSLSKNATTSEFIKKAKVLLGNKYTYGEVPNEIQINPETNVK